MILTPSSPCSGTNKRILWIAYRTNLSIKAELSEGVDNFRDINKNIYFFQKMY